MAHDILVGEYPPLSGYLSGFCQGYSVEVAQDPAGYLGRQGAQEIDFQLLVDFSRHSRQLGEAALRHNPLQHEIAMFGGRRREQAPDLPSVSTNSSDPRVGGVVRKPSGNIRTWVIAC